MSQQNKILSTLRRPRLLVRAARLALSDYNRARDLSRLTGESPRTRTTTVLSNLIAQEEYLEETRQTGDATYRATKHIEVLVALMAECRLLPRRVA